MAVRVTGAAGNNIGRSAGLPSTLQCTIMGWFRPNSVQGGGAFPEWIDFSESGANPYRFIGLDTNGTRAWLDVNGTSAGGSTPIQPGNWYHYCYTRTLANEHRIWLNGRPECRVSVNEGGAVNGLFFGSALSGSSGADVRIACVKVWNEALSQAQIVAEMRSALPVRRANLYAAYPLQSVNNLRDISPNSNSLTASGTVTTEAAPDFVTWWPRRQQALLREVNSAAGILTASVAETGSASDTPSETLSAAGSVAETGSAADTPSETLSAAGAVAESGSAADTPSSLLVIPAGVAESGSAADAQTETLSAAGAVVETGSAADTPSETMSAAVAVAETGSAADTPNRTLSAAVTVAESGTAADAPGGVVTTPTGVVESGSAVDTQSSSMAASANVAETGAAADAPSAQGVFSRVIAEIGSLIDAVIGFLSGRSAPPSARVLTLGAVDKVLTLPAENRVLTLPAENRTLTVEELP